MFSPGALLGAGGKTPTSMFKAGGRGGKAKIILDYRCKCEQQMLNEKAQQVTKNQ